MVGTGKTAGIAVAGLVALVCGLIGLAGAATALDSSFTHDASSLTQEPQDYRGIRLDRRWTKADTVKPFGSPSGFANAPLPDNTLLDTSTLNIGTSAAPEDVPVNPATPNELQRQADAYGTYLNRATFTAPITIVPANQPLTPVRCVRSGVPCASALYQMMAGTDANGNYIGGGLPIPDDYVPSPTSDTDAEAVFYQPDYVGPAGHTGRMYEAWKLRPNDAFDASQPVSPANPRWTAAYGGRVVGTQNNAGHYVTWQYSGYDYKRPGAPNSTYQDGKWGVLASGLFIINDEVSREDCALGQINHAIGIQTVQSKPGYRWPAQRHDGTMPSWPVVEGMRLRFPPDMPRPQFSSQLAGMIFDAAQQHGLVVSDNTASALTIRIEPTPDHQAAFECSARMSGVAGYDVLKDFPWDKLQVLATGTDNTANLVG